MIKWIKVFRKAAKSKEFVWKISEFSEDRNAWVGEFEGYGATIAYVDMGPHKGEWAVWVTPPVEFKDQSEIIYSSDLVTAKALANDDLNMLQIKHGTYS